jgi:hypothetical protein
VVFALIDALADAFEANAFHVGWMRFSSWAGVLPEVQGHDPAKLLFAKAVNDLHAHIAGERKWKC